MTDRIKSKGVAALGTRFRRLSERLDRDVREAYDRHGFDFEPSWFPVVTILDELGPKPVGELATLTGVSQPAISQIRKRLADEGLIATTSDPLDHRRSTLSLSAKGRDMVRRLRPLWDAIAQASDTLVLSAAPEILNQIDALERALDQMPMSDRINTIITKPQRKKANPS